MHWNPSSKNFNSFHTHVITLFNRAWVHEWIVRCPLILKVLDDDIRRAVRFPSTEEQFWMEAHGYYFTEMTLESSRFKGKSSTQGGNSKGGSGQTSGSSTHSGGSVVVRYTCGELGHTSPMCPKSTSQSGDGKASCTDFRTKIVFFNCGENGHFSRDCTISCQTAADKEAFRQYSAQRVERDNSKAEVKCSSSPDTTKRTTSKKLPRHRTCGYSRTRSTVDISADVHVHDHFETVVR